MKFEIKAQLLALLLKKIIKTTSPNPPNEVYKNIKIEVESDKIILYTLNERTFLKTFIAINDEKLKIFKKGTFVINLKILNDILSKLKDEWILFEMKINNLIITNFDQENSFIFKLKTNEIETFPTTEFKYNNKIVLPKNIIEEINNQITFVINNNNSSQILRGINFIFDKNNLTITATDQISMAQKKVKIDNNLVNKEITIPISLLNDIEKITNDLNTEYTFYLNNEQDLVIEIGNFLFKGRLINGSYPKIQNIINVFLKNEENNEIVINDVKTFLNTLELAVVLAKKEMIPLVEIIFNKKNKIIEIICISNNNSYGEVNEQFTNFTINKFSNKTENNLHIVFNYYLLIHALKSFTKCKTITLTISPNKHTIISSEEDNTLVQLVLPVIKN